MKGIDAFVNNCILHVWKDFVKVVCSNMVSLQVQFFWGGLSSKFSLIFLC